MIETSSQSDGLVICMLGAIQFRLFETLLKFADANLATFHFFVLRTSHHQTKVATASKVHAPRNSTIADEYRPSKTPLWSIALHEVESLVPVAYAGSVEIVLVFVMDDTR